MKTIEIVDDKILGKYFAYKTKTAKQPFKNQMKSCHIVKLYPEDIVVDIGAYVGEYSMYASTRAKKVYSYEASPETFKVLQSNKRGCMDIFNVAIVGGSEKIARLYLSKGVGATNSIVKSHNKAGFIDVPAINYIDAVKSATIVKIDVEGTEYSYDIIQPNLRAIILEFHPIEGIDWKSRATNIIDQLLFSGFKTLLLPQFRHR